MKTPLLSVKGLKKYFPIRAGFLRREVGNIKAVDDVSFSIAPGEVLGLVGESGSGKSTIARTAIRLIEPTAGSIQFEGRDLLAMPQKELKRWRRHVQMVFQDPYNSLNPRKTIGDNIGELLRYHHIAKNAEEEEQLIADVLDKIGLPRSAMQRYPHQFSGGQQQRVCIGRAIAMDPKLIICDEPLSSLDVSIQAQILNLFAELKQELNLSYLFITHDLTVAKHICDRIVVLHRGRVVESAPTEQLFGDPQDAYTKQLLAAIPVRHPRERKRGHS